MTSPRKRQSALEDLADDTADAVGEAVHALAWLVLNLIVGAPVRPWSMLTAFSPRQAAWRLPTVAGLAWLAWLRAAHPEAAAGLAPKLVLAGYVAGAIGAAALGWSWAERWLTRDHRRDWVAPAWDVMCRHFGYDPKWSPDRYLHLTPAMAADPRGVRVQFPVGFEDQTKRTAFEHAFKRTLGLGDVNVHWEDKSRWHFVQFTEKQRMPADFFFSDVVVRDRVMQAPEHRPVIGGGRTRAITTDFNSEAPHLLASMSTGGGKSELFKSLLAHFMRHGAWVVVLDIKRASQQWLRGLPGVEYHRDLLQMHHALIATCHEGERRNKVADDFEDGAPPFRRIVLCLEELNATINKLQLFWETKRNDPDVFPDLTDAERKQRKSPAVLALNDILYMGRAVKINVLACGQLATAAALGGPAVRECFSARILGRATKKAWAMLADLITNPPKVMTKKPGRFHLVVGPQCDEVQGLYMADAEARDYAMSGSRPTYEQVFTPFLVPRGADASPRDARHTPLADALAADRDGTPADGDTATWTGRPHLTVVADPAERGISMARAAREHVIPMKADAIRQARRRDPEFPQPISSVGGRDVWDPDALRAWYANRPRSAEPDLEPVDDEPADGPDSTVGEAPESEKELV